MKQLVYHLVPSSQGKREGPSLEGNEASSHHLKDTLVFPKTSSSASISLAQRMSPRLSTSHVLVTCSSPYLDSLNPSNPRQKEDTSWAQRRSHSQHIPTGRTGPLSGSLNLDERQWDLWPLSEPSQAFPSLCCILMLGYEGPISLNFLTQLHIQLEN